MFSRNWPNGKSKRSSGKDWICLGRADEVAKPGDYITSEVAGQLIVATCDKKGAVRSFSSVCRHRSRLVADGEGNASKLVCPFHGWCYDLDGRLSSPPRMKSAAGFDKTGYRLPPIRTEICEGWIYVTLDDKVPPLAERFVLAAGKTRNYRMAEYTTLFRADEVRETNWKLFMKNFMEPYHVQMTHEGSTKIYGADSNVGIDMFPSESPSLSYHYEEWGGGFLEDASKLAADLINFEATRAVLIGNFPSHVYAVFPGGHMLWMSLHPEEVSQVRMHWGAAVAPSYLELTGEDPAGIRTVYETLNAEDKAMNGPQYQSYASPTPGTGPLLPLEAPIREFGRYLAYRLCGYRGVRLEIFGIAEG
jgi:choline monooxygenase